MGSLPAGRGRWSLPPASIACSRRPMMASGFTWTAACSSTSGTTPALRLRTPLTWPWAARTRCAWSTTNTQAGRWPGSGGSRSSCRRPAPPHRPPARQPPRRDGDAGCAAVANADCQRDCFGYAFANRDANVHAWTFAHADRLTHSHADADGDANCDRHVDPDRVANCNDHRNQYADTCRITDADGLIDAHADADGDAYCDRHDGRRPRH